jgi:hypothetical protein
MILITYTFINLFLNSFIMIIIHEIFKIDNVIENVLKLESSFNQLFEKQKKKVLITFSKSVSFLMLLVIPVFQILITLFAYGIIVENRIYWLFSFFLSYDLIEIYIRNKSLELKSIFYSSNCFVILSLKGVIFENVKQFIFYNKQNIKTKEFIVTIFIIVILSNLDISTLNVTHCLTIFYITEILVFYEKFLIAFELTFKTRYRLNNNRISILKKFNHMVWIVNYILQFLLIAKIIIRNEANVITYLYIYTIPILWYNT